MAINDFSPDDLEKLFVYTFLHKEKRNRVLFELSSKNKREHILDRLWNVSPLYREEYIIKLPFQCDTDQFKECLGKYGCKNNCYVMSGYPDFDRKFLTIDEGIVAVCETCPTILILSEKLAFFKDEDYARNLIFQRSK
jgi:hypothetical protein